MTVSLATKRRLFYMGLFLTFGWSMAIWHDFGLLPLGHLLEISLLNFVFYAVLVANSDLTEYGTQYQQHLRIFYTLLASAVFMLLWSWAWEYYAVVLYAPSGF